MIPIWFNFFTVGSKFPNFDATFYSKSSIEFK